MAIDYGSKRVGIAVTDPLRIIVSALDTVSPNELLKYFENYFQFSKFTAISSTTLRFSCPSFANNT